MSALENLRNKLLGTTTNRKAFAFSQSGSVLDIVMYGDVFWYDIDAIQIAKDILASDASEIIVHMNSYGGDVFDGLAIYNSLKNSSAKVTTITEGLAASAMSIIAMAGDVRIVNTGAMIMIHEGQSRAIGDASEMRKTAEMLDKINESVVSVYVEATSLDAADITEMVSEETWMTAAEAQEFGFATEVSETVAVNQVSNLSSYGYRHVPEAMKDVSQKGADELVNGSLAALKARAAENVRKNTMARAVAAVEKPEGGKIGAPGSAELEVEMTTENKGADQTAADEKNKLILSIMDECTTAGIPEAASVLATSCETVDEAKLRIIELEQIKTACAAAKCDKMFGDAIKGNLTLSTVTQMLSRITEAQSGANEEINTESGTGTKAARKPFERVSNDFDFRDQLHKDRLAAAR